MLNIYWSWILLLICLLPFDKQTNLKPNFKNLIILTFFSFLLFFIGFRYESVDYGGYKIIFDSISFESINFPQFKNIADNISIEFIFGFLISIFKELNFSFYSFIFIFSLISLSIKFFFIKKYSPYFFLSSLLFFAFLIGKDMGQIRNAMIAGILLFAIFPLIKRNFLIYISIVLIASGIQIFALIALPIYWLYPYLTNKKIVFYVLLLSFVIFLLGGIFHYLAPLSSFLGTHIHDKITIYINSRGAIPLNINTLSLIFFALLFTFIKEYYIEKKSFYVGLFTFYIYSVSIFLICSDLSIISSRIIDSLGSMALIILIPFLINKIESTKIKIIAYGLIVCFCIMRFIPMVKSMENYQNIFF